MSQSVDQAHVAAFTSSIHHALQQKSARFMGSIRTEYGVVGASYKFELLGDSEMVPTPRHGDTQYANDAHTNELAILKPFNKTHLIDDEDKVRTLLNLENDYSENIAMAYYRRCDQSILEECVFPTTTSALTGTVNGGLDFDTVSAAREHADASEWDESDRFFAYSAQSLTSLLDQTEVGSSDYNTINTLNNGKFSPDMMWMGFKWRRMPDRVMRANGKVTGAIGSVTGETNYFYHKSGCGLAFANQFGSLNVRMSVEGTKNYATQVQGKTMLGGQVIEDALVVPVTLVFSGG
jgi:hypothetical protein